MSAPISADLRERLARIAAKKIAGYYDGEPPTVEDLDLSDGIVDAIVAALIAEGWRHLPSVMAEEVAARERLVNVLRLIPRPGPTWDGVTRYTAHGRPE